MNQDLEQRGGRTLSAIDNAPTARVPATRRAQRSITLKGVMVADPPEKHLPRHALVDTVQQLLDDAGARFGGRELELAANVQLSLGATGPSPFTFGFSVHLSPDRGNTCD